MIIRLIPNSASDFADDDYIALDGEANGSRKMKGKTLLKVAAENAIGGNISPEFDPTKPNDDGGYAYYSGENVTYEGKNYVFVTNHISGPWNATEVEQKPLSKTINLEGVGEAVVAWLDAHPEATTTVEDQSLTGNKLVIGTLNFVTPEMFGAAGDGVTDDTQAIQNAMDACSVVFFGNKTYLVSAPNNYGSALTCNNGQKLYLNNATIKLKENNFEGYRIIIVDGVENVLISGGTIIGDRDDHIGITGEWGHGICITESKNVVVENVVCNKCWGDSFNVSGDKVGGEFTTNNVLIKDCIAKKSRRQGLSIISGMNIRVVGCSFYEIDGTAPMAAIDVEPNAGEYLENVYIENCYCDSVSKGFQSFGGAGSEIKNLNVVNCKSDSSQNVFYMVSEGLYINNFVCNWLMIGRGTKKAIVRNLKTPRFSMERNTSVDVSDSIFEKNSGNTTPLVYFYTDGPSGSKIDYANFSNCSFIAETELTAFVDSGFYDIEDIKFENCRFENKNENDVPFTRYGYKKLVLKSCELNLSGWFGFLFTYNAVYNVDNDLVIDSCKIKLKTKGSIFNNYGNTNINLTLKNSVIDNLRYIGSIRSNTAVGGTLICSGNTLLNSNYPSYYINCPVDATDNIVKHIGATGDVSYIADNGDTSELPANPVNGQIFIDTTTNKLLYYNSGWYDAEGNPVS